MQQLSETACFGGRQLRFEHASDVLSCDMRFSVYLPPAASTEPVPVLYWLSGLTCTDENFMQKSGAQKYAAEAGLALVAPDTSPRGDQVADDPDGSWDFGLGAGFYVNATQAPYDRHYQMYDYVVSELPGLLAGIPQLDVGRAGISGHSMGGHGALTIALKNPDRFQSVSAFAPICAPMRCPWGKKALSNYVGDDTSVWRNYDACELIAAGARGPWPILVDQGMDDAFLHEQLMPDYLEQACAASGQALVLNRRPKYDHSYYFVASFIAEHIGFHAVAVGAGR